MVLPFRSTTNTNTINTSSIIILSSQRSNSDTEGPRDETRPPDEEEKNQAEKTSFSARLEKIGLKPVKKQDMRRKALLVPPLPTRTPTPQRQSYRESKSKSKSKSSPSNAQSANLSSQEFMSDLLLMKEIGSIQSVDEFQNHIRMSRARTLNHQFLRQHGLDNLAEIEFDSEDGNYNQQHECWE